MKRLGAFIKTTTLGGLFVLLPVVLLFAVATTMVLATRATTKAAIATLAGKQADAVAFPIFFSILALIVLSFLLGLLAFSRVGRQCGTWIQYRFLRHIPGYAAARAIVGGIIHNHREGVVMAGLMTLSDGVECFVVITETHTDDKYTIYVPNAPNPASGSVRIVRKSLVRPLDVRITDIGHALQQWGIGCSKVLANLRPLPESHATLPSPVEQKVQHETEA